MYKILKISIIFAFCLSIQILSATPRFRFEVYSTEDGLPQKRISGVLQDKKGFIWLCSWNGLSRFDGYSFSNYKKSADNTNIPLNSRLRLIKEDSNNNIWCLSYDRRVYLFNTSNYCYIDVLDSIEKETNQQYFIKNIVPMSKNRVWIVCEKGIVFCANIGTKVEDLKIDKYDISNNGDIYSAFEDNIGDVWVLANNGTHIIGDKKIENKTVYSLFCKQDNTILLSTSDGRVTCYDQKNRSFIKTRLEKTDNISYILPVCEGKYAIVSDNDLLIYDPSKNSVQPFNLNLSDQIKITDAYKESENIIWIFTNDTFAIRVDLKSKDSKRVAVSNSAIKSSADYRVPSLHKDKNGDLWIITKDGYLAYYDSVKNEFCRIQQSNDGYKFSSNLFREQIFVDNQDNLWIPTINGIYKITIFSKALKHTEHDTNYDTRAIFIDKQNNLWTGTKAGVIRIYDKNRHFRGYLSSSGTLVNTETNFSESGIYSIMEDSSNNIWIGTKGRGIYCVKTENDNHFKIKNYRNDKSVIYSLNSDNIYCIYEDSKHQIWAGSYGAGLNLMRGNVDSGISFINANNELKNYPLFKHSFIRNIAEAKSGVLLVGTTEGLLTFSHDFDNVKSIKFYENHSDKNRPLSMKGNDVMHIFNTHDKQTYIATSDGGINKIKSPNLLTDTISFDFLKFEEHSPTTELFQALIEDKDHNIWIVSEDALVKYIPSNSESETFRRSSFINNDYYSEAIPALDPNGDLIIGTETGILNINPRMMTKASYAPPIAFTNINIQGEPISNIGLRQELNLSPSQRNFSLSFAALDYVNSNEINYAYRLEGVDDDWIYIGKSRSVSYANLPHGEYTFQIKSTNSDGVWMDNITELKINVLPKFSETILAKILFVMLTIITLGAIGFIIMYIYKLRYKVKIEQQLADVKLHFFTDISHELRTPLTLISGPVTEVLNQDDISPKTREYLTVVNNNVTRMSRLVNEILDIRKIQNEKMKLIIENVDLIDVIRAVMQNFEILKQERQIDFRLETNVTYMYCWVDREKMEKILFNLISNAFKYTPNGKSITVKLTDDEKQIYFSVIDEGVGISTDKFDSIFERFESFSTNNSMQASSGIGLSLVKELVNMHHAKIELESKKNEGSEFTVILLKGKSHFNNDSQIDFLLTDKSNDSNLDSTKEFSETENLNASTTILIVEDNDELRNFLSTILLPSYKVIEASNGAEGLSKAKTEVPDFIITDIAMPEMDGLSMIKLIKDDKDICHIPIIVLSAKSSLDDQISGLDYGIEDYIIKPFSAAYLKTKIKTVINQRKQLQNFFTAGISKQGTSKIEIEDLQIRSTSKNFVDELALIMNQNLDNSNLNIDDLATLMNLSRSVFYRKMVSIMGMSPLDYIRKTRIAKAKELIRTKEYTFSQVAYKTGFSDPKYFGKSFKKETGMNPSEFE